MFCCNGWYGRSFLILRFDSSNLRFDSSNLRFFVFSWQKGNDFTQHHPKEAYCLLPIEDSKFNQSEEGSLVEFREDREISFPLEDLWDRKGLLAKASFILPSRVLSCRAVSFRVVSCCLALSSFCVLCVVLCCLVLSRLVLPYLALSCLVPSCVVLCCVVSCVVLHCLALCFSVLVSRMFVLC